MSWPAPIPGLVIRYSYLWQSEAALGVDEGAKDRPCAIILAIYNKDGETVVYVLPISHSSPSSAADAVELPHATKKRLGLDDDRSWIVLTEANVFTWPGSDLCPVAGRGSASVAYGVLPPGLLRIVRERFVDRARSRRARLVTRSD